MRKMTLSKFMKERLIDMNDLEMALVCFINEYHRKVIYQYEKYQILHNVKFQRKMEEDLINHIREAYLSNCFEAAYELKTYYAENGILSNTIVLKMRPASPEMQEFTTIKVHSDILDCDIKYSHHAVEIFKEHGKYKVFDILHTDRTLWLESYLDELCCVNNCERNQLRYDLGYLAPCHAFASNMQELSDLMRYLDKVYCIGKPRISLMNLGDVSAANMLFKSSEGMLLSDDIAMDFDTFGRQFGSCTGKELIAAYHSVYDRLMGIRFNMLHVLCLGHIMRDPIVKLGIAESIFDDARICELMDKAPGIPGHVW